jgi:ABC-type multidrug transport system fused ATPase/permease subunit
MMAKTSASSAPRVGDYFKREWRLLVGVTLSGIVYNVGMTAGPWFEGQLAQRLCDILGGARSASSMLPLALAYVAAIALVQGARFLKRLYVRKFANNVNLRMKGELYANLLGKTREEVVGEGVGTVMTKAVSDVDDCAEGMRKFTTEIFDTGVVLVAYTVMLLVYDWRLALIVLTFPPVSYAIAMRMRKRVAGASVEAKASMGRLNAATLDRTSGALSYRVFGLERARDAAYEDCLDDYERAAGRANTFASALQPLYKAISLAGAAFVIVLGARNVMGLGWTAWDIASFTTFMSCFEKLAIKSSSAAKLFNAVQKARVSWERIEPYLGAPTEAPGEGVGAESPASTSAGAAAELPIAAAAGAAAPWPAGVRCAVAPQPVEVSDLRVSFGDKDVLAGVSLALRPGQIVGVTGAVASGKSALGRAFLCERPADAGTIRFGGRDLAGLVAAGKPVVGYLGHDPELISDTVEANVRMGAAGDVDAVLAAVRMDREVAAFPAGRATVIGDAGVRLSGGQQARIGLARTLFHPRPLIVLDDPFSAVDSATEQAIFRNLRAYVAQTGSAVLLISHRLTLFPQMNSVVYLEEGHAVQGSHADLLATCAGYRALCALQSARQEGGAR